MVRRSEANLTTLAPTVDLETVQARATAVARPAAAVRAVAAARAVAVVREVDLDRGEIAERLQRISLSRPMATTAGRVRLIPLMAIAATVLLLL